MMEGGGQLLRMSAAYSAILGESVHVINIRAARDKPGLRPQHLTTLLAVAKICGAEAKGLEVGSGDVEFNPGPIRGGSYAFDVGTAGSLSLLLQSVAPIAAFADSPVEISLTGGTAVRWSPPMPIVTHVVWPAMGAMGFRGEAKVEREGFYPKGGGHVEARIRPIPVFKPFILLKPEIAGIGGSSVCSGLPRSVAERQASSAARALEEVGFESDISVTRSDDRDTLSPGSYVCLWTRGGAFIGSDSLGEKGMPSERVGAEAARRLLAEIKTGASVDRHTADNLILPCSLADGESTFTVSHLTMHALTAAELARKITGANVRVEGREGKQGKLTIRGIGARNPRAG